MQVEVSKNIITSRILQVSIDFQVFGFWTIFNQNAELSYHSSI